MYCNYCGKSIQDDANICAYCGTRVGGLISRKRLVRPREGRKVAGVCMGMAEYFDLDVTLVRVVWLIMAFMTGVGFLGAGVIFKDAGSIQGLNTAATIWCSAAIGAISGLGNPLHARF